MNTVIDLRQKNDGLLGWTEKVLSAAGLDGITVYLINLPQKVQFDGIKIYGITDKLPQPNSYRVYINPSTTRTRQKDVICHEAVHIKQYQDGRLSIKDKTTILFDGKEYKPPYNPELPHEKEAFRGSVKLRKLANKCKN